MDKKTNINKSDLLNKWLNRKTQTKQEGIAKRPTTSSLPLSFGQKQIWIMQQLYPTRSAYQYSEMLILEGELNIQQFQHALNQVVLKHEVLRTTYQLQGKSPVQCIQNQTKALSVVDVSNQAQPEEAARNQLLALSRKAFDLEKELPFRVALFKLNEQRYFCLGVFHDILIDAMSTPIFWDDLSQAYQNIELKALSIHYADFAYWQQAKADYQTEITYWKKQLHDLSPLNLPLDFSWRKIH